MTFSQYAGTAIVPTLARIVLAAVFVATGWNKVKDRDYDPTQAARLKRLGVSVDEVRPVVMLIPADASAANIRLASFAPQSPAQDRPQSTETAPPTDAPASDAVTPETQPVGGTGAGSAPIEPLPPGQYRALGMYGIALMLEDHGVKPQMCVWGARAAAFTELLGGAMLLIGLFSRIWGLGLAATMGVAFYLVTVKTNGVADMTPFVFAQNLTRFNIATAQLALFVLAFGVFLTGAGPLSVDRMLFGRDNAEEPPGISPA